MRAKHARTIRVGIVRGRALASAASAVFAKAGGRGHITARLKGLEGHATARTVHALLTLSQGWTVTSTPDRLNIRPTFAPHPNARCTR